MNKYTRTEAIVYSDGYGGISVLDDSKTHKDIRQYMKDESVWEVFDGLSKQPKGKYRAVFDFWWERGSYEYREGDELVIGHEAMRFEPIIS